MTRITRASRRLVVLLALVTAFLLLGGPALAHVTANPNTAPAGTYFRTAFRVGHGCDGSPTTEIRMQIPPGLQSVRPEVVAGWDVEVVVDELEEPYESHGETVTEGPVEIIWSGGNLPDEHFQEFGLSMKTPDTPGETIYFPFVQICEDGEPIDDCYRVYHLPRSSTHPAHVEVDRRGLVWYTGYWGNLIGVLNPETGRVIEYPLPEPIGLGDPVWIVGSGPWQILEAPDGDIVFCEFFDSTIGKFNVRRILDPACRSLGADGFNPCIDEWIIPDVDLRNETVHSIAFDLEGRLWYTIHTVADYHGEASLGYLTADFSHIVRLPSLEGFPADDPASAAGVAIDPTTGDVYFCEFWRQRIGRLRRVE